MQICPPAQSAVEQHAPLTQAPPQHFCPAAHWASPAQAPQKPFALQVAPPEQSAVVQQFPLRQDPLQQRSPKAQSLLFWQTAHELFLQILPAGQSLASQQAALAMQAPLQQREFAPQSRSAVHTPQEFPWQTYWPQLAFVQQLPSAQVPLQHTRPLPQSAELAQAAHW